MNKVAKYKPESIGSFVLASDLAVVDSAITARIEDMPDGEYHSHPSVSKSMLHEFLDSSEVFDARYNKRTMPFKKSTSSMNLGTIIHAVVLEGKQLDEIIAVVPDTCLNSAGSINSRGTAYKEWFAENGHKIRVKKDELDGIRACLESVYRSELNDAVSQSKFRERAVFWTDQTTGLECRCKPDFFIDVGSHVVCYDLKISTAIDPVSFTRQIKRFRYWLQDQHYSEGLRALTGKPVYFRFWVVEPVAPYRIRPYSLSFQTREVAQGKWLEAMSRFNACKVTGDWTDRWPNELVLSEWDFGDVKDDELNMEGLE